MISSNTDPTTNTASDNSAKKRRLEMELLMNKADQNKLVRRKEELDMRKRTLKQALHEKEEEMAQLDAEEKKLVLQIQAAESEVLHIKRQMNTLT